MVSIAVIVFWFLIGEFYKPPYPHNIRGIIPAQPACDCFIPSHNSWDVKLKVRVWEHSPDTVPTILFVHGWDSSMGHFAHHIQHYYETGYRVVAVDFRSHGESEHKQFISVFNIADDLQSTLMWIHRNYGATTLGVWAHSLGGVALIIGIGYRLIDEQLINYAIIEGIYAHGNYIVNRFARQYSIPHSIVVHVLAPLMKRKLISTLHPTHPHYAELKQHILTTPNAKYISPVEHLTKIDVPLLSIHARNDPVVAFAELEALMQNKARTHEFLVLESGGHFKTAATNDFFDKVDAKLHAMV